MDRAASLRFVAQQAMLNYQHLSNTDRIKLLDGLAEILDGAEAENARHLSFLLQQKETHQLLLFKSLAQ